MRRFLLTLDTIGILCLVYSNFCANKLSIKYQLYPKSTKINTFEHKIFMCHNLQKNRIRAITLKCDSQSLIESDVNASQSVTFGSKILLFHILLNRGDHIAQFMWNHILHFMPNRIAQHPINCTGEHNW